MGCTAYRFDTVGEISKYWQRRPDACQIRQASGPIHRSTPPSIENIRCLLCDSRSSGHWRDLEHAAAEIHPLPSAAAKIGPPTWMLQARRLPLLVRPVVSGSGGERPRDPDGSLRIRRPGVKYILPAAPATSRSGIPDSKHPRSHFIAT
jgi:hypothetical protein